MDTTSSITMQSLGKIAQCAPAVGAKMWCLLPAGCREAANCRYCFHSQAKNQVFLPAGATRCTDSGQTLQDRRVLRVLITVSIITMRSRLFPASSASDCVRFAKSRPQFCESCGAIYRRKCEMFIPLQSTSGPVTDVENSV